jgi:hypothetical protein
MHTLYLGPSWAVQSYESFSGDNDVVKTNLAQELGLSNFTQIANYGKSNLSQLTSAKKFIENHAELAPFNILFVMSESLTDGPKYYNLSREKFAYDFLTANDPITIIKNLETDFYQQLSKLQIPMALIGAHTDIVDFDFAKNITVLHPSWQNFLGSCCNLDKFFGWPCEIANLWLQGKLDYNTDIRQVKPSKPVVFEIDKLMSRWTTFQLNNLWNGVHPTILGNQLFAKEIADSFNQWIDNVV